jgi:branched-chain amino acid transport system substrate-binding protein
MIRRISIAALGLLTTLFLCGQTLAAANPIKIGAIGPITHISGKMQMRGLEMARDEINQAGGISVGGEKRPIELIQRDTNELKSVADAVTAVERLITVDKVDFVMGGWRSEAVLAMQDVGMDYKKVMITEGSDVALSKRVKEDYDRYKYWFRAYTNNVDSYVVLFTTVEQFRDLVKEQLGVDKVKVAIVLDKSSYTDPYLKIAPRIMEEAGCEVVGLWRPSMVAKDMSAELLAIKNKGAHLIWAFVSGPSGLVLSKQWAEYKIPAALIGCILQGTFSTFMKSTNGKGNYVSTWTLMARVKIRDKTIPYWDKFGKTYGIFPDFFATYMYDNLYRLKAAIEQAGSLDPDKIVTAFEKLVYVGAAGTYTCMGMDTDTPHDCPVGPKGLMGVAIQWQDGQFKAIWPPADGSYQGVKYEGVVKAQLPPWMIAYWENKK